MEQTALTLPKPQDSVRIREELKAVGATAFGLSKFASRFLPHILHENEHIKGVVYGRYMAGGGFLRWAEGMLVATDRRMIFVDRKPGFETVDELTYDIVSGVKKTYAWPFSSMTLHTRLGDYTIRFANNRCIETFMHYVESRRLESTHSSTEALPPPKPTLSQQAVSFLNDHTAAVLSAPTTAGDPQYVAVQYLLIDNSLLCLLAKGALGNMHRILRQHMVALTLYDPTTKQALELQGMAQIEPRHASAQPKTTAQNLKQPTQTPTVLKVSPYRISLTDFSAASQ